jgi:hypothetical protein
MQNIFTKSKEIIYDSISLLELFVLQFFLGQLAEQAKLSCSILYFKFLPKGYMLLRG